MIGTGNIEFRVSWKIFLKYMNFRQRGHFRHNGIFIFFLIFVIAFAVFYLAVSSVLPILKNRHILNVS